MKPVATRFSTLAFAVLLGDGSALAGAHAAGSRLPGELDVGGAAICVTDVAGVEWAVARPVTAGSLTVRASVSLDLAALSRVPQPEATEPAAATGAVAEGDDSSASIDKSGTDPTKFLRTLSLRNEYQRLPNETSFNITSLTSIEPFADGRMNLRLKAPFVYTDAAGDDEFGLGGLSLRYNWLPIVDREKGVLLSAELIGDTAIEDVLGRGKWIIGPSVTCAMFGDA